MSGHILVDANLIAAIAIAFAAAVRPVVKVCAQWIHSQMVTKIFTKAIQDTTPDQRPPIILALAQLMAHPKGHAEDEEVGSTPQKGLSSIRFLSRFVRDVRDDTSIRG